MSESAGDDGIRYSANNLRWECLVYLAELLSNGKTDLEHITSGVEKPYKKTLSNSLVLGFTNKGKRSPRNRGVGFVQSSEPLDAVGRLFNRRLSNSLVLGFKNKGKRSPRNKSVGFVQSSEPLDSVGRIRERECRAEKLAHVLTIQKPSRSKKLSKTRMAGEKKVDASKKRSDIAPDLPEAFKKFILDYGCDLESVILVTQKVLTMSDVNRGHGKLSVRYSQIRNKFLKEAEVEKLDKDKGEVRAILIQPCLEEGEISLRNWKSNLEYALIQDWNEVCRRNALSQGMKIQLWSFRGNSDDKLCFILVKVV